jgi:hypothetical protein
LFHSKAKVDSSPESAFAGESSEVDSVQSSVAALCGFAARCFAEFRFPVVVAAVVADSADWSAAELMLLPEASAPSPRRLQKNTNPTNKTNAFADEKTEVIIC